MTQDALLIKEKILSELRLNGPNLPVYISKKVNLSPLFASAFLSELFSEKKIKLSHMKVGSSPLYLIPGQEPKLEKFAEHLKSKEKDAFLLLKEKKFLRDIEQEPAIRVALRAIRDFAVPFKKEEEIYWRYFTIPLEELNLEKKANIPEQKSESVQDKKEPVEPEEKKIEISEKKELDIFDKDELKTKVLDFLKQNKIRLLDEIESKKREFTGTGRIESDLGELEILIIAKDKKKISGKDFEKILKKVNQDKKMVIFLATGELDKKTKENYRDIKNIIKFAKI